MNKLEKKNQKKRIKKAITEGKYSIYFIIFFIGFYIINMILNKSYIFYTNIESVNTNYAIIFIIVNFLVAGLVALTFNLIIIKLEETKNLRKKDSSIATIGIIGGIIGGGCPACFVGVLPAIIGFFGLGISFSDYPYLGIIIQIISGIILATSIHILSKDPVCKVTLKK